MIKQLKTLSLNDKVKFGKYQVNKETPEPIIWKIAAKNHVCEPAYPLNSVTLYTDKIIDKLAMDAMEPSNPDSMRSTGGNNNYRYSNLSQWLNSSDDSGKWYVPQHLYDAPPENAASVYNQNSFYAFKEGFLFYFSPKERESILPTIVRVTKNISIDGGGYDDLILKIFLPSTTELGLPNQNGIAEGNAWPIFPDAESRISYLTEQCFANTKCSSKPQNITKPDNYWLRTATTATTVASAYTNVVGISAGGMAYSGNIGVRPALNLSGDTLVSENADEDGCYTVIFNEPPAIDTMYSGDIGVLSTSFKQAYTVYDPDGDLLTINEKLNGEIIRTLINQTSGTIHTFDLTALWQTLSLDTTHTAAIEVTDGTFTNIHEWIFTRSNITVVNHEIYDNGTT